MARRTFWRSMTLVFGGALGGVSLLMAAGHKPPPLAKPVFSSWLTYWDAGLGRIALNQMASQLEEVQLFAYHFDAEDALVPASVNLKDFQAAIVQLPGPQKPRLSITLVNDVAAPQGARLKDPGVVHRVIATPAAQAAHVRQIMTIAEGAQSIDINYERVAAEDGPAFTLFVQALATALHERGKRLSVIVEPRVSDRLTANNALSWKDIAQSADQITVMAYLYHYGSSAPGSIAPVDWVGDIAAYGLSQVPAQKLSIALHLGGFDWPKEGAGKSLEYDKAAALASAYGASIELDPRTQSGHFTYSDGSSQHEVWIETAAGLKAKVERILGAGVTHIALWRLGERGPGLLGAPQQKVEIKVYLSLSLKD